MQLVLLFQDKMLTDNKGQTKLLFQKGLSYYVHTAMGEDTFH